MDSHGTRITTEHVGSVVVVNKASVFGSGTAHLAGIITVKVFGTFLHSGVLVTTRLTQIIMAGSARPAGHLGGSDFPTFVTLKSKRIFTVRPSTMLQRMFVPHDCTRLRVQWKLGFFIVTGLAKDKRTAFAADIDHRRENKALIAGGAMLGEVWFVEGGHLQMSQLVLGMERMGYRALKAGVTDIKITPFLLTL